MLIVLLLLYVDVFHVMLFLIPIEILRFLVIFFVVVPSLRVIIRHYYFNNLLAIFFVSCMVTVLFGLRVSFIDPAVHAASDGV